MAKHTPTGTSLADQARQAVINAGPLSKVTILHNELLVSDPVLAAEFMTVVLDPDVSALGLSRAMAARGHKISANSIAHYRMAPR